MDGLQPILGNELRNIRTPQQLQELSRRVQAEINSATVTLSDNQYSSASRMDSNRQSTPSRPSERYEPHRSLRQNTGPFQDVRRGYISNTQRDNGAHNGAPFSSELQGGMGRGMPPPMAPQCYHALRGVECGYPPHSAPPDRERHSGFNAPIGSRNPEHGRHPGLPDLDRLTLRREPNRQNEYGQASAGGGQFAQQSTGFSEQHEHSRSSAGGRESAQQSSELNPNSEPRAEYRDRNERDTRNSTLINQSDEDVMDRVYNLFEAPLDYRQRSSFGPPPPYRSREWDDPNCSEIPPCGNSMYNPCGNSMHNPGGNSMYNAGPIWQFRGPEFKPSPFSGASEDFPDWRATFRAQVDSYPEQLKVPTLRENLDPDSKAFVAYISDSDPGAYQRIWEELERRCCQGVAPHHRYTGKLLELINGPQVHDLRGLEHIYNTLNHSWAKLCGLGARYAGYAEPMLPGLSNILFDRSQKAVDRLSSSNRLTVPNVLTAIWDHMSQLRTREHNQRICARSNPTLTNQHDQRSSRSYNLGSHGAQLMKTSVSHPPQDVGQSSSASTSGFNRRPSPDRSRNSSPSRNRSPVSSPNRIRSSSPSTERRKHFRCSFCEVNDHSHLDCTKFSSSEQFHICKTKRLCFVCRMGGHGAWSCPFTSFLCVTTECKSPPPHCVQFCQLAKTQ